MPGSTFGSELVQRLHEGQIEQTASAYLETGVIHSDVRQT